MGQLSWYKRDPDAALQGMFELTLEERGAYNTVLDLIYSRADNLPDDDRYIAGCCGCDLRVWRRIKKTLIERGKLHIDDGFVRNNRATSDVLRALAKVASCREAARTKHAKSSDVLAKNNGLAHADAEQTHVPRTRVKNLDTDSLLKEKNLKKAPPNGNATDLDADLYRLGRELLGPKGGSTVTQAKRALKLGGACELFQTARTKENPAEYIYAALRAGKRRAEADPCKA